MFNPVVQEREPTPPPRIILRTRKSTLKRLKKILLLNYISKKLFVAVNFSVEVREPTPPPQVIYKTSKFLRY